MSELTEPELNELHCMLKYPSQMGNIDLLIPATSMVVTTPTPKYAV